LDLCRYQKPFYDHSGLHFVVDDFDHYLYPLDEYRAQYGTA